MVDSEMEDRRSLARLKALDSLPDLESQLAEAKSICNHNARAEMISRWLMGRLKSSPETCKEPQAWEVLAATVRLISPQKIALLLSQLPGVLQATVSAQKLSQWVIYSIAELLNLLLDLGRGADGSAIKALLSLESPAAASLCGNWFRHLYVPKFEDGGLSIMLSKSLLDPSLQIWELRKRQDSDDMDFNNHCLVSVLPILGVLNGGNESGPKRKRGEPELGSARSYGRALESLVAKHTILPARSAFFRKTDPQARRLQRGMTQVTIGETLAALKNSLQNNADQNLVRSAPIVLDIALRSVSTPTPRHRVKERTWVEAVLAALRDCLENQTEEDQSFALVQLLGAVRINKATLPVEILARIITDNIARAASSKTAVDWRLVASVIELDANVLSNASSANEVFDEITNEGAFDGSEDETYRSFMESRWRDEIIVPIMKAYAQSRTLEIFVDCWYKQLQTMQDTADWSVWDSIGDALAEMLEGALPAGTILELIDRFTTSVQETVDSKAKLADPGSTKLRGALCVLESLLQGVRSDALISAIQSRLDRLFSDLFGLSECKGFKTTIASDCHHWRTLTRVFELWYPHWASKQAENDSVASMGVSILSNQTFKSALTQCSAEDSKASLGHQASLRHSAQMYVATLSHCFGQYGGEDGCAGKCKTAIEHIAEQKASAADVFVQFPSLLATLQSGLRKDILKALLKPTDVHDAVKDNSATRIRAILCSFQGINKTAILEEFSSVAVQEMKTASKTNSVTYEAVFATTMASIDTASLDQTQRTNILDSILQLPAPKTGTSQLRDRLALVLKLASLPCQDSRLFTDASALWDVVGLLENGVSSETEDESRLDSVENVQLFEEISKRAIRSWLASQDREKSRALLVELSKSIKRRVKSENKAGKLSAGRAGLALLKIAIAMIESDARDAAKELMVHREAKVARAYIDLLTADVETFGSTARNDLADLSELDISNTASVLEALLDLPNSFLAVAGMDPLEHANRISIALNHVRQPYMRSMHSSRLAVMRFRLEAKYMLNKDLLSFTAIGIIENEHPSAREQSDVLSAYEKSFADFDVDLKLKVALDVLTRPPCLQSVGFLLLVRAAIEGLSKEDFDSSSRLPTTLLHRNLQAASQNDKDLHPNEIKSGDELLVRRTALRNLVIIFKEKPFMVNQYGIEQTLYTLQTLLTTCQFAGALYLDMTQVLSTLFLHHRSRLQGRFHLVISTLQALLAHLFRASTLAPPTPPELCVRQARALARLFESFSNPPPLRHYRGKGSDLVDESRKAQAHAGQFTQYLLHHYCAQVLTGSLGEGVREALLPGLWAVIEAMEVYSSDAIKSLSAAVNNSERAVLRSVYDDWKRFGKWEGL